MLEQIKKRSVMKVFFIVLSLCCLSATVFSGLEQAELNRGIKPNEIVYSPMEDFLYNEKWHFMAQFDSGWALYSNIMVTNIATAKYSGGVEFSLYSPEGKIYTSKVDYGPEAVKASRERYQVEIGSNRCGGEYPKYHLDLDQGGMKVNLVFENQTPGWKPGDGMLWFDEGKTKFFKYLITSPRAKVTGSITVAGKKIPLSGYGLQDYSKMNISASDYSTRWLHIRVWDPSYSVIFTELDLSEKYGSRKVRLGVVTDSQKIILQSRDWEVKTLKSEYDDKYKKQYPSEIGLSVRGDDVSLAGDLKLVRVLEKMDVFAQLNVALKTIVYAFIAKPVFYRCQNQYQLELTAGGKKQTLTGKGLNEVVYIK
jgi:hypothetical protein